MLFPTTRIKNQVELGKAVDLLLNQLMAADISPREKRDMVFTLATLTRLAKLGLALAATGAEGEKAIGAVSDTYVRLMSTEAAKALGLEQVK